MHMVHTHCIRWNAFEKKYSFLYTHLASINLRDWYQCTSTFILYGLLSNISGAALFHVIEF